MRGELDVGMEAVGPADQAAVPNTRARAGGGGGAAGGAATVAVGEVAAPVRAEPQPGGRGGRGEAGLATQPQPSRP